MSDPIQQDPQYQEMASLLNYESNSAQTVAVDSGNATESENLYFHPEDEPTQRRFSQRGLTKLGFVSAGTILAFLVLGQIINQLFRSNPATQTATQPDVYEEQDRLTMSLDIPTEDGDPEVGSLRTEVALQKQAQQLENMQAELQEIDQSSSQDTAEAEIAEEPTPAPTVVTRPAPSPPQPPIQPFTPIPIQQTQAPQPPPPYRLGAMGCNLKFRDPRRGSTRGVHATKLLIFLTQSTQHWWACHHSSPQRPPLKRVLPRHSYPRRSL